MLEPNRSARDIFEADFLKARAELLSLAATLDRVSRGIDPEVVRRDPRWEKIRSALAMLAEDGSDRAERIQLLFSREYREDWLDGLEINPRSAEKSTR